MCESRVIELQYRIVGGALADDVPPLAFSTPVADFLLQGGALRARPRAVHRSIEEASAAVEVVLRSWELEVELREGVPAFTFVLESAEAVGAPGFIAAPSEVKGDVEDEASDGVRLVFCRNQYPDPPTAEFDPALATAWHRIRRSIFGLGEPVQAAAYYLLTLLERRAGGRREAQALFRIHRHVLAKLGELTSTRGEPQNARKAQDGGGSPLTHSERAWIQYAVRAILLQVGIVAAGHEPPVLTLEELPRI